MVEEFSRFILNDYQLTSSLKKIRHKLQTTIDGLAIKKSRLIEERNSRNDVGKDILAGEASRKNYFDILLANLGRVKESIRVLEEFSKLVNKKTALNIKEIRYIVYDIEKKIIKKFKALHNIR